MDDLDQLQLDFEKLISTCAVRNRYLRGEIESIDKVEERRDRKGKSYDKGSLKRKRPDDKTKYRDLKNGARPIKRHYPLPVNSLIGDVPLRHEIPKINLPKNDTSDKFWATVEPYCAPITNSHMMVSFEVVSVKSVIFVAVHRQIDRRVFPRNRRQNT
jgi:transcriptional adapter 3